MEEVRDGGHEEEGRRGREGDVARCQWICGSVNIKGNGERGRWRVALKTHLFTDYCFDNRRS